MRWRAHRAPRIAILALLLGVAASIGCGDKRVEIQRIVFVTLDTTRADRLGCYGYDQPTSPNLDRLAEESTLFESAISQVPTTLPSHSTMFTGLYPQDHGVRYNLVFSLSPEAETLAEILKRDGYRTAAFPAAYVLEGKYGLAQGFDLYEQPNQEGVTDQAKTMGAGWSRPAGEGVDDALGWLEQQGSNKSFLWLHFYDAHSPYSPPFPYSSQYRDRLYDGEIAYTDAQFGRLLDALKADPAWENTLVVVAGDHGEGLHEHRERWHSYLVYDTTQRVPLLIRAPGSSAGRVAEPVVLADLMPTVLDLAGLPIPENLRGVSLRPAINGDELDGRFLYFETHAGKLNYGWQQLDGVRFQNWKLIDSSEPELYNLAEDPGELVNLAAQEPDRVERFRAQLTSIRAEIRDGLATSMDEQMSPEDERRLAALGYVAGGGGGDEGVDARTPQSMIDVEGEIANARLAIAQGNWPQVEELCGYVLTRDPFNKWALTNLTLSLLEQGRAEEAESPSKTLVEKYPTDANSWASRGRVYSETGRAAKAYEELTAIAESPTLSDSEAIGYFRLVAGFDAGVDLCGDVMTSVQAKFQASPRIMVMRARCDLRTGAGVERALLTLDQAVQLGYKQIESLRSFDEFEPVTSSEEFDQLVERSQQPRERIAIPFEGDRVAPSEQNGE